MPSGRRRHVPQRSCIACRGKQSKRDLIRIVRRPEGTVEVDLRGKLAGRGAYVCPTHRCWETAVEQGRLERALRCKIGPDQMAELQAEILPLLVQDVKDE